jgi:hypothetical protein
MMASAEIQRPGLLRPDGQAPGLPVLLTINARAMARSLAALALGFVSFDPEPELGRPGANKVGSEAHAEMLRQAMQSVPGAAPAWGPCGEMPISPCPSVTWA